MNAAAVARAVSLAPLSSVLGLFVGFYVLCLLGLFPEGFVLSSGDTFIITSISK